VGFKEYAELEGPKAIIVVVVALPIQEKD